MTHPKIHSHSMPACLMLPHGLRAKAAWGVLLLALVLRGLIPAGYMPQARAADQGKSFAPLGLCYGHADVRANADVAQWLADLDEPEASEPAVLAHAFAPCLFAVCLGQTALPTGQPIHFAVLQLRSYWAAMRPVVVTTRAYFLPVGARAPPLA